MGEADCESSQRQVLATSPVEVQDEGHGRASVMPSSVDVECSNELQKTGIQEVNKAMNKRLYTSFKKYAVRTKEHRPIPDLEQLCTEIRRHTTFLL